MKAMIKYKVDSVPHPWDEKLRKDGVTAYCLIKRVIPEYGSPTEEPVAIFNYDSDARDFMGQVFSAGVDGKLIEIAPDIRELFELQRRR